MFHVEVPGEGPGFRPSGAHPRRPGGPPSGNGGAWRAPGHRPRPRQPRDAPEAVRRRPWPSDTSYGRSPRRLPPSAGPSAAADRTQRRWKPPVRPGLSVGSARSGSGSGTACPAAVGPDQGGCSGPAGSPGSRRNHRQWSLEGRTPEYMSSIVHVPDELAGRLEAEAARRGVSVDNLSAELLGAGLSPDPLEASIGSGDSGDPGWAGRDTHELRAEAAGRRNGAA